jgi:hypothetical protein
MADTTPQPTRAPWHLWVVGVLSLVWNSIGAFDFVMTETRNAGYLSALKPEQREYYFGFPIWVVAAWGVAVWGGVLGSLLLLLRRRLAAPLFLASVAGMILTDIYTFVLSDGMKINGGAGIAVFSAVIFAIGIFLLAYAGRMCRRGVLR